MTTIVGSFRDEATAEQARSLLRCFSRGGARVTLHAPTRPGLMGPPEPRLLGREESILRAAVRWGLWGSVLVELPSLVAILLLSVDVNVKVLLAATVWKFGAGFGAWLGAMAGAQRGVGGEVAAAYQAQLDAGQWLVAVSAPSQGVRHARGALLESGALEARDIEGTFEARQPRRQPTTPRA